MFFRIALFLFCFAFASLGREANFVNDFDRDKDTLSFANDTLWIYGIDAQGHQTSHKRETPPQYAQRCFVMCRTTLQFHKFVQFDPTRPPATEENYRELVRYIARIPVWSPVWTKKAVIPGYANLHDFSKEHAHTLQAELGNWWPSYFRIGNWRMALPFPRSSQRKLANELVSKINQNKLQAVFLTRFRPINHCLIAYGYQREATGDIRFLVYDPNDAKANRLLVFENAASSFYLGKTEYFKGGRVNAFKAYIAPWR